MAIDKAVDSIQLNTDLTTIANAIRAKGGTSGQFSFPAGMVSAINAILTGITPIGTKSITSNANGIDVTDYACVDVNVPVLSKSWLVTFASNQSGVVTLITDTWLASNYSNSDLMISVAPSFALAQALACTVGGCRCNYSIGQISGQTAKTGYRMYHTANNANPSSVLVTGNVSGGSADEVGKIGLDNTGTLRISVPSSYPLLAGSYKITASVQQEG